MDTLSLTKEARIYNGESEVKLLSRVQLFVTPWTVAYQASLSMGFSRQEYRSGLPFPFPEDLPNPGIEPGSPTLQAAALPFEPPEKPNGERTISLTSGAGKSGQPLVKE